MLKTLYMKLDRASKSNGGGYMVLVLGEPVTFYFDTLKEARAMIETVKASRNIQLLDRVTV